MRRTLFTATLAVGLILGFLLTGQAQSFSVLQGKVVTQDGQPVTSQPLVIEGWKESNPVVNWLWFGSAAREEIRVQSVTDQRGEFQIINLPAGQYAVKLLRPGTEPITISGFKLDRGYDKKRIAATVAAEALNREGL